MEMKKFNYIFEIDILRNFSRIAQKLCSAHVAAQLSLQCKQYERYLSPSNVTFRPDSKPLAKLGLHYSSYCNWPLATYPFIYSSQVILTSKKVPPCATSI